MGKARNLLIPPIRAALAWYGSKITLLELEGIDISEDAAKCFNASALKSLRLDACSARTSTLISRLSHLSEIIVVERGHLSIGCDYVALLSHVKVDEPDSEIAIN